MRNEKLSPCKECGSRQFVIEDWSSDTVYSNKMDHTFSVFCTDDACSSDVAISINTDKPHDSGAIERIVYAAWNEINKP